MAINEGDHKKSLHWLKKAEDGKTRGDKSFKIAGYYLYFAENENDEIKRKNHLLKAADLYDAYIKDTKNINFFVLMKAVLINRKLKNHSRMLEYYSRILNSEIADNTRLNLLKKKREVEKMLRDSSN